MAVQLTGTSAIFTRFGVIGQEYLRVVNNFGTALNAGVSAIWNQYPNSSQDAAAVSNLINAANISVNSDVPYLTELQNECINTTLLQVNRDVPLQPYTLNNALITLIGEMVASGQTIQRPTTSDTVTPWASNKGDAIFVASLTNRFGDPLDLVVAENINILCTSDSSTGATPYSEIFTYSGEPSQPITNYLWPQGSGAQGTVTLTNSFTKSIITDGGFQSWGGAGNNTPTYWPIVTGAALITQNTTSANLLRGVSTIQIGSDGSTLTEFQQAMVGIQPLTVYAVNFWAKISSTDSSGQFKIRFCDGAGNTLTNFNGSNLAATIGTNGGSGISSSFTPFTYFWATGRQLPTSGGVYLDFAYTTSPSSGKNLYIDLVGVVAPSQFYPSGPYIAGFSKANQSARGDYYTLVINNSAGAYTFSNYTNRMFNMGQSNLYFPSASSPSIPDALL